MSDFADVVLSVWPDVVWLIVALCALLAAIGCWQAAGRIAGRSARRRQARRERDLPRLSRAVGTVERRTQAMDLGGLVITAEAERHAAWLANRPTGTIGQGPAPGGRCPWCADPAYTMPEHCACQGPCEGIAWCAAWWPGDPVPVTWTGREEGVR